MANPGLRSALSAATTALTGGEPSARAEVNSLIDELQLWAAEKQREVDQFIDRALSDPDPRGTLELRESTADEVAEIIRQGGPDITGLKHVLDAQEIWHAFKTHGGPDEAKKNSHHRPLTAEDLKLIPAVLDAPTEMTVQAKSNGRFSVIYGRDFGNGKIEYVERIFMTSRNNKPRAATKSVWVRDAATGVKSSPPRVFTPYRTANLPFSAGRVNPDAGAGDDVKVDSVENAATDGLIDLIDGYAAALDDDQRQAAVDAIIDLLGDDGGEQAARPSLELTLDQGLSGLISSAQAYLDASPDAATARYIWDIVVPFPTQGGSPDALSERSALISRASKIIEDGGDFGAAMFDRYTKAGAFAADPKQAIADVAPKIEALRAELKEVIAAYDGRVAAIKATHDEAYQPLYAELVAARAYPSDDAAVDALYKKIDEIGDAYYAAAGAERDQTLIDRAAKVAEMTAIYDKIGQAYIDSLMEASPVSAEQAEAWAAAQTLSASAQKRLQAKDSKYPIAKFRADMAEFYRLSGGKLSMLTFDTTSKKRAYAQGIHGHAEPLIAVSANFNKRVLFHEMAHHLEADPMLLAASKHYLAKRRKSDKLVPLRKLTGNKSYKAHEKAYEDSFFDPYVGTYYDSATEVFSMGMESFHSPALVADRASQDPEHFALMMGAMKLPSHPLQEVVKVQRERTIGLIRSAAETAKNEWADTLAQFIADVSLDPSTDGGLMASDAYSYTGYKLGKLHGFWRGCAFYEAGAMRNPHTGRTRTGVAIFRPWDRSPEQLVNMNHPNPFAYGAEMLKSFDGLDWAKALAKARLLGKNIRFGDTQRLKEAMGE